MTDGDARPQPTPLSQAIRGAKGGKSSRTPVEAPDTLNSNAHAHILDLIGEGELAGWYSDNPLKDVFLDETPVMNEDGTLNFTDVYVDWRMGTQDQTYMKGFPSVSNEIGIGVELKASTPWTRSINNIQLSAVNVRLSVAALSKTNPENGDINGHSVSYAIDLKTDDGAFITVLTNAFTGKTNTKYERSHRIDLPQAASSWTIRVRRLTPDTEAANIQDTTYVESLTEIMDIKLRYPNSALVGTKINAAQFRSIPSRAFRMLGRLMRVPSNYDSVAGTYTGMWDGTFKMAWTRNPAWIFYDLITNERFGLGQYVNESQVDKWSLYKIGQYCDELVPDGKGGWEPRFTCTVFLQKQEEAYKVLQDLASVFRGISYWGSGAVIPVSDMPRDPVYTYTNANVKDGKFSYQGSARRARHTVALVSWSDPNDFNRQKVEYVEDEEAIARYGYQPTQITAVGCTSQGQAQRVGRWLLLTEKYETNTVTFAVGMDQILAMPGQIINVADAKRAGRRTGGRIASASMDVVGNTSQVTVDSMPALAIGDDLICILPNGTAQKRPVTAIVGNTITVSPRFDDNPIPESIWAVESPTLKTQLYSVISVGEGEGLTAVITALQHEPGKFDAVDNSTYIEERPTSAYPNAVQRPPTNLIITAAPRAGYVLASTVVTATWTAAEGATSYDVQWRRSNGEWSAPQKVLGTQAELFNAFPGEYVCMVSARNSLGIVSVPAVSETFIVPDQSLAPGFVDDINADINTALEAANNAQATADGAIEFFWQTDAPVIGAGAGQAKEGDFWIDTNDGNRMWRATGGVWVDAQDDQIGQALIAAQTAQSTADGKVKTFFGPTAPVASAIGDLWFNTTTKKLFRWNGSNWSDEIADVTRDQLAGNGINLLPDEISIPESGLPAIEYSTGGSITRDAFSYFGLGSYRLVSTNTDQYHVFQQGFKLEGGKKYLLSMYVYSSVASAVLQSFFDAGAAGNRFVNLSPAGAANTWSCVTVVVDLTHISGIQTFKYRIDNHSAAGVTTYVDGIMLEEMIGSKTTPSVYSRGQLSNRIAQAIAAAAAAQETADGKIETFYQPSMPSGASLGDLWFDTDDGNKLYRHDGTTFVPAQDAAIGQAISLAAGAQATADGKVTTYYASTAPTGASLGDLWFNANEGNKLYRYNGTTWVAVQDAGIAQAIAAAAAAQDTADGKIETFYQSTPPAIGTGSGQARLGDLWFDTGNGNKLYRCNGSSWVVTQDAAIGQAINLAAGAQATADGKVTTYYSSTQPTATAVGDLWYDTSRKTLYRWSGSQWILVGDNSLETQATATLVKDGGFEAGGQGWMLAPNARIDRGAGVPYIGSAALTHDPVAGGPIRQSGCEMFAVAPGERIVAEAMLRNWQGGANGYAALMIWFYDEAGSFIATGAYQFYANGRDAGSNWRKCTALALVPANARLCRIGMETTNSTGYWVGDQFRALKQPQVEPQPSNLIPNANFGGINGDHAPWVIGWNPAGANIALRNKKTGLQSGAAWTIDGSTGVLEVFQNGRGGGSPGVVDIPCGQASANLISVVGGQRYELHIKTSNHRCQSALVVGWQDSAGAGLGEAQTQYVVGIGGKKESDYVHAGAFVTAPANAAYARVWIRRTDTDAGQNDSYSWYIKPYFGPAKADQQDFSPWVPGPTYTADEIATGSFGVVSAQDLWDAGGTRRVGLRVHGSGHRLGSQSNAPQSLTTAYGSVRNTTALTASSDGTVSVNAHTVRYGGFSVSYNAVSNAVTGLAQNTRYVIYCFDPDYTGGTKTWYAGPNPDTVMQLGDGVVIAGEVTIPTSGTSSGGGGAGGGGSGDDWCVDYNTVLPDGRLVRDLRLGDLVECIDVKTGEVGMFPLLGMGFGEEECYRLVTPDLCSVIQSKSTPMDLPDGSVVTTPSMFGKPVYHKRDGVVGLSFIADLQFLGLRRVCKPDFGNRMFFAGERADATIATHNAQYKP